MDNVDDTTLMQKWRAHWNTRDRIFNPSPQAANRMGVTLFWTSNIILMYTTLYVTAVSDDDAAFGLSCYWWRVIAWFLWFQTSYNWFLASLKVDYTLHLQFACLLFDILHFDFGPRPASVFGNGHVKFAFI